MLALGVGACEQLVEIEVTLLALTKQHQTQRLAAIGAILQPHVSAHDWLYAGLDGRLTELHGTKHIGQIGYRHRWHTGGGANSNQFVNAYDAVRQGKFGMQMQMNERRAHAAISPQMWCSGKQKLA